MKTILLFSVLLFHSPVLLVALITGDGLVNISSFEEISGHQVNSLFWKTAYYVDCSGV